MLDFLRGFRIFNGFTTEHKAFTLRHLKEINYKKGDFIIKEGETEKSLYLLYSGTARVIKITDEGETAELAFVNKGDYFGEFSLIDDKPRSASVQAFDDCTAYKLSQLSYAELCRKFPEAEISMLKGFLIDLTLKLRDTSDSVINRNYFISI